MSASYRKDQPTFTFADLNALYQLTYLQRPIKFDEVHPAVIDDLLAFLKERKTKIVKDKVSIKIYRDWIKRIYTEGLSYPLLITKAVK